MIKKGKNNVSAQDAPPPEKPTILGITGRRGAIKKLKVHEVLGHKFVAKFFRQFTYCSFCSEFLW